MTEKTSRCVEIIRNCSTGNDGNHCKECPYLNSDTLEKPCVNILFSDAADLIESLSETAERASAKAALCDSVMEDYEKLRKQFEQVTRERDAAVNDINRILHKSRFYNPECSLCHMKVPECNWNCEDAHWRGVEV